MSRPRNRVCTYSLDYTLQFDHILDDDEESLFVETICNLVTLMGGQAGGGFGQLPSIDLDIDD